jgi:hypothetical protein
MTGYARADLRQVGSVALGRCPAWSYRGKLVIFCDTMRSDLGERAGPAGLTQAAFLR